MLTPQRLPDNWLCRRVSSMRTAVILLPVWGSNYFDPGSIAGHRGLKGILLRFIVDNIEFFICIVYNMVFLRAIISGRASWWEPWNPSSTFSPIHHCWHNFHSAVPLSSEHGFARWPEVHLFHQHVNFLQHSREQSTGLHRFGLSVMSVYCTVICASVNNSKQGIVMQIKFNNTLSFCPCALCRHWTVKQVQNWRFVSS